MENNDVLLEVRGLNVVFNDRGYRNHAVRDVSFSVHRGEVFGLAGESGSGKSTIARTIMRLQRADKGEVFFQGKKISGRVNRRQAFEIVKGIQMIFQDPASSMNDRANIFDVLSEGLKNIHKGLSKQQYQQLAVKALTDVGLSPEDMNRFPHSFSGGQLQRIGIARALLMQPQLIIADEPVSALDLSVRGQILNLMNELKDKYGLSYLFIAHDLSLMRNFCDRIAIVWHGRIVELGKPEQIFRHPIHPYTRMLLSAIPVPNPDAENMPSLFSYPSDFDKRVWQEIEPQHFALVTSN